MKERIVDYIIEEAGEASLLAAKVRDSIRKGYQPFGGAMCRVASGSGGFLYQPMVKREFVNWAEGV